MRLSLAYSPILLAVALLSAGGCSSKGSSDAGSNADFYALIRDAGEDAPPNRDAGFGPISYSKVTLPGPASNVVIGQGLAFAAMGAEGVAMVELATGKVIGTIPPASGSQSIDDLALAEELLFALDATAPGFLSVFSTADPRGPKVVSGPVPAPVGPFSGVSAVAGRVVVSGGTSALAVWSYDAEGALGAAKATADLGASQVDVLLGADHLAFVSTQFSEAVSGADYGITVLRLAAPPQAPESVKQVGITGAGGLPGAREPANFPLEAALAGRTLAVAHRGGLSLIDVVNPQVASVTETVVVGVQALSVDIVGRVAFVVGEDPAPRLVQVDVGDLEAPFIRRFSAFPEGMAPTGVAASEHYIAIAANDAGLLIVER